jgi:hypothetical protein
VTQTDKIHDELRLRLDMVMSHYDRAKALEPTDPRLAEMEMLAALASAAAAARVAGEPVIEGSGDFVAALRAAEKVLVKIRKELPK